MTWSIQAAGKPAAVQAAIDRNLEQLTGGNRDEFAEVAPALKTLVGQCAGEGLIVKLTASGHGQWLNSGSGEKQKLNGSCSVTLDQIYGFVE